MTDHELLEMAAKAAGIADGDVFYDMDNDKEWNPLTDDGDALRLAVKLELEIRVFNGRAHATALNVRTIEPLTNDPYVATRRAIVRAAAELGKSMP